jgi:hypothetical protein
VIGKIISVSACCSIPLGYIAILIMLSEDVVGFYFLDLATSYQPPPDLVAFLEAGPPPVYIGYVFPISK